MSPPEPPRPGKRLSVTDVVAPGAVHQLKTLPPSNDRRPEPRTSMLGVKPAPALPSDPPESIRDSREITTDALLREAADRAAKLRAAEASSAAKDAEIERLKRLAQVDVSADKFDAIAYFQRWQVLALKFFLPVAAILGASGIALGIYNKTTLEPKLDRAEVKQEQQKTTAGTLEERVKALEKYTVALAKHSDCVDAERDSAIERGTGHVVEGDHASIEWVEQNAPAPKPRVLWKNPPWSIAKDEACPSKPAPPRIAP